MAESQYTWPLWMVCAIELWYRAAFLEDRFQEQNLTIDPVSLEV